MFCQLEMLRHCLAPSLRRQLNELPKSLDETYERVLKEIESTNQGRYARRLLQCLVVAMRPLRVEELAEVLAFDLDAVEGELPSYHVEWRWENQEQAVLSACSSLISIVDGDDSRIVQFSHFSVKEYLTSDRLATASGDVSRYHIVPEPAHLILTQACLGVLLNLDNVNKECDKSGDKGGSKHSDKDIPLLKYAAEQWASHAQVGNVSSHLKDAMEPLFDLNKPYFLAWILIHNIDPDTSWYPYYRSYIPVSRPKPLYYAALCGFYDLVRHLIVKHPAQVNYRGGNHKSPLVAALSRKHVRVAELLLEHSAHVHVRGDPPLCRAIRFSDDARVNAVQFLLRHGADVNAGLTSLCTPLHLAAAVGCPEVAQILLKHWADVDLRDDKGQVPLHLVSSKREGDKHEGERLILARLLVERCADVNVQDMDGATPLHFASHNGRPQIAQLLLDHGANAHTENVQGRNLLHELSRGVHETQHYSGALSRVDLQNVLGVAQLLLELGMNVNAQDKDQATPLHFACSQENFKIALVLLDNGADPNAQNADGQTPLHRASQGSYFHEYDGPRIAQLLLERGVDVNAQDKNQATPLHLASYMSKFKTVQVLLDHGAEADAQNADGQTPLHRVSQSFNSRYGDSRIERLLLERGVDVNAQDKDQETPLHVASSCGNFSTTLVLLDHGAEVSAQNADGQTPLHRVLQGSFHWDSDSVARLLLERGVDVNARDKDQATPLHLATYKSRLRVVQVLLDHGAEADAQNADGQTPLHRVSQGPRDHGGDVDPSVARLLLERGVDVNARDKDQETPLHLASYYGHVDVAEVLFDQGARVSAEDIRGQTPLHQVILGIHDYQSFGLSPWSRKSHPGRVVRLAQQLLERGADVNAQNKDHETPLHLASRLRLHEMARFLLKHGADVNVKSAKGKSPLQLASGRKGKAMKRLLSEYSAKQV